jgi:hypothetical protein
MREGRQEVEEDGEDDIDGEELDAFQPVSLSVAADLGDDDDGNNDRDDFGDREFEVHWVAKKVRDKDENWRDKEGDLQTGADSDP